jgi:hypothetical protein
MSETLAGKLCDLLTRLVVPAWVLAGAIFKLAHGTAKNLPHLFIDFARKTGVNLDLLLAGLIGLEFFAAAVMIFLPRWSRHMAVFMLSVFCGILIIELAQGAESCGCFGDITLHPGVMLAIDGSLLLAVIGLWLATRARRLTTPRWAAAATVLATLAGFGISFARLAPRSSPEPVIDPGQGEASNTQPAPDAGGRQVRRPPSTYLPDCSKWPGLRWEQLDIAQYMEKWPRDISTGRHYVIFYQRTCEHCYEFFEAHAVGELSIPTHAVAIPEGRGGFATSGLHPMVCNECEQLELPIGCDWVITTPIVVAVEDGVVVCAQEGDEPGDPKCLQWGSPAQ